MKKILLISITALLALASCVKLGIDENPVPVVNASDPTIAISDAGDTGFKATITAAEGTGFYSYAILEGAAKEINPTTLLKVGTKAPYQATVDYKEKTSVIVETADLKRNTDYTVYAVAASTQGTVGKVVTKTIKTGDTLAPSFASFSRNENKITLTMTEPVELVEGVTFTAKYYAPLAPAFRNDGAVEGEAAVEVKISGANVEFTAKDVPAGAYFSIDVPAGAFKDALGNLSPGPLTSSVVWDATNNVVSVKNLANRVSNQNFELTFFEKEPITKIQKMNEAIWFNIPEGTKGITVNYDVKGTTVYENSAETRTFVTSPRSLDFGWNSMYNCALAYPNAGGSYTDNRPDPARGDKVTMNIPEGFLIDQYGNKNEAITVGPLTYSYGYTAADIVGTYPISGKSAFAAYGCPDEEPFNLVIKESDNPEKGNLMITSYIGIDDLAIYFNFDYELGTASIPMYYEISFAGSTSTLTVPVEDNPETEEVEETVDVPVFMNYLLAGYNAIFAGSKDELVIEMPSAGTLNLTNDQLGYLIEFYLLPESGNVADINPSTDYLGSDFDVFNAFSDETLVRSAATPDPEPATPEALTASVKSMNTFVPFQREFRKEPKVLVK